MYIVTFTAHQQRKMVQTPQFFWAGDTTNNADEDEINHIKELKNK